MRLNLVLKYIGMVMLLDAGFMAVSAAVSAVAGDWSSFWSLLLSATLTAAVGMFPMLFVPTEGQLSGKEGYCIVVGAWLASCVVGMLPFLLWGDEYNLEKAWFESVSGFTTTGATTIADVESLPRGLLFWRSCTQWIGGAGVVMFAMLILPVLGRSRMMVSSVELSSVSHDDYKYTSGNIIRILLTVYLVMSALCAVLLRVSGMGWFDAVNHSMATIATGGFSTRNMSLAYWNSPLVEGVIMIFMVASGIHFGVIFATFTGRRNNIFRSEVVRYWICCMAVCALVLAVTTRANGTFATWGEALRYSSFQSVAAATTSGFVAADTEAWGPLAMVVLTFLGIQCACAGSTGGGLKADRVVLAAKIMRRQIHQQQHPNAVIRIKLGGVTQEPSTLGFVMLFIVAYISLLGVGTAVTAAFGYDLTTSFSLSVASLGNVGVGFGKVGGFGNWGVFPPTLRFFTTALMLLGRLEIFGLLQLFFMKWWR